MAVGLRDLLITGRTQADPWHRVHCCDRSVLVLIEFCQRQGPCPIVHYPPNPGPHLNLDQVALWLMSSENCHDSQVMLYNQQMDLHALVHHIILLDITARAFQRKKFAKLSEEMLRTLLACNRRMFRSYGEHLIDLSNEIQHEKLNSYYSLFARDELSPTVSNKIQHVAKQMSQLLDHFAAETLTCKDGVGTANRLNLQFMDMFRLFSSQPTFCDCGRDAADFKKFAQVLEKPISSQLVPLLDLAPCASTSFTTLFEQTYTELTAKKPTSGVLFSAGFPIYKNCSRANYSFVESADGDQEEQESDVNIAEISRQFPNENSLRLLGSALVQCLYPVLTGQRMTIVASDQRISTAVDLLQKLNAVRICKVPEKVNWREEPTNEDRSYQPHLSGLTLSRERSAEWARAAAEGAAAVVLDLNRQRLHAPHYDQQLLQPLGTARLFPDDRVLTQHVVATLAHLAYLARVAKRVGLAELCARLRLKRQDALLLANVLAEYDPERFLKARQAALKEAQKPVRKIRF